MNPPFMRKKTAPRYRALAALLLLLLTGLMMAMAAAPLESKQGGACVVFINAGKADSTLIHVDNKVFLIDAGSKDSAPALLAALEAMGVSGIDGLFLTHTHSDHIGGLKALVRAVPVERLYFADISLRNAKGEHKLVKQAEKFDLPYTLLQAGDRVEAGGDAAFTVLGPLVLNEKDDNDNSLVLAIELGGRRFLFAGDMQFPEEVSLLESGIDVSAHVLRVGNHGNPDATSIRFAIAVSPEYAVISTNTEAAPRSANDIVIANLFPAKVFVTEGYALGIRVDISNEGDIRVSGLSNLQ